MTEGITYALEHTTDGKRWFFSKWLDSSEKEARLELVRMRSLAAGVGTEVAYRVQKRTVEELPW